MELKYIVCKIKWRVNYSFIFRHELRKQSFVIIKSFIESNRNGHFWLFFLLYCLSTYILSKQPAIISSMRLIIVLNSPWFSFNFTLSYQKIETFVSSIGQLSLSLRWRLFTLIFLFFIFLPHFKMWIRFGIRAGVWLIELKY